MSDTPLRRIFDYSLLLAAAAGGECAIWALRKPWAERPGWNGLWCVLIGAGLLGGVALRRMEVWLPEAQPVARPVDRQDPRRFNLGYVCLACALGLTTWLVLRLWPNYREWHGTPRFWLAALALTVASGWLMKALGEPAADESARLSSGDGAVRTAGTVPRWVEVAAFLSIAALAVFLRTYRLSEIPAGIYVDETNGAIDSLYILEGRKGRDDSPFGTAWYETPTGYIYYMAALFKLFGATHLSLKAASVIPAVLTVLAVYPLGRVLFGPTAAISAMLLMAVSRWHLTMSRWGWNEVAPPVFQVLGTFFLVRGLRERRALDFAAGGLTSGLMVYTYLSSRLALATLAFFAIYWMLADPDGPVISWKRHWKGFMLFLVSAVVAVAPIAVTYITNPFSFVNRVSEINIFNQCRAEHSFQPFIENVERHLKFFHQTGDHSGKHNLPGEPETDPVTGLLFVIGLGHGLVRLGDRRRGLLWLWMIFAMVAGMFSVLHESPQAYRTLNAVPAVALLAGDVLARLSRGLMWLKPAAALPATPRPWRAFSTALAGLVLLGGLGTAAAWEISVYFGRQAESPAVKGSFNLTESWVAKEVIAALNRDTVVYLSPRFYDFSPLRFLVYGVIKAKTGRDTLDDRPYRLARPEVDLPVPDTGSDALFLLDRYYYGLKDYFLQFYPAAQFKLPPDPENRPLCLSVQISRDQLAALQGLNAQFNHTRGGVEKRTVARIDEDWGQRAITAAEWSGGMRVERSGEYDLTSEGELKLVVDDVRWTGRRFLARGLHKIEVTQERSDRRGVARLSWTTPQGSTERVPAEAFFRVAPPQQGLTARYFANENWQGDPLFTQTTPFILLFWPEGEPLLSPFSVRFTGSLRIREPGAYSLRIEADDGARLLVDGKLLAEALTPLRLNRVAATIDVSAGDHPIQIDYFQRGGSNALEFYWRGPDGSETPVPPDALIPENPSAAVAASREPNRQGLHR